MTLLIIVAGTVCISSFHITSMPIMNTQGVDSSRADNCMSIIIGSDFFCGDDVKSATEYNFLLPRSRKGKESCHNWWTVQHHGWMLKTSGCNSRRQASTSPWESQSFCFCWHWAPSHGRPTDTARTPHTPEKAWLGSCKLCSANWHYFFLERDH